MPSNSAPSFRPPTSHIHRLTTCALCAALAFFSSAAVSADWQSVGRGESKVHAYIDVDSVAPKGKYTAARLKLENPADETWNDVTYRSMVALVYFDCAKKTHFVLSTDALDANGKVVYSQTIDPKEAEARTREVDPDSVMDSQLRRACVIREHKFK